MMRLEHGLIGVVLALLVSCGEEAASPPPADGATEPGLGATGSDVTPGAPGGTGQEAEPAASQAGAAAMPGATSPGGTPAAGGADAPTTGAPSVNQAPPALSCSEPALGSPALRLLTRGEFERTINAIFPEVSGQWSNALPSNTLSVHGFDNDVSAAIGGQLAQALLETAEDIATAVSGAALANILPCSSAGDQACAEQFIADYGRRLFRRPLTATEVARYSDFFVSAAAQTDFATAIKWVLVGLIQSPNAVYRSEIGQDAGGVRQLSPHETVTELAYTFTGSTPSAELLDTADSGQLGDLVELARGMLATEAGRDTLHRFFEAYTGYPRTQAKSKPNATSNGVAYSDVAVDMVAETRAFIDEIVMSQGGDLTALLTSQNTNPSSRLASFYGFDAPSAEYASVARPAGRGLGLLAQGSFLATHANSDASSPTQRGVFVYTKMLCQAKPPVPDNVPQLPDAQPEVQTTRQRYEEVHSTLDGCGACHQLFDPIGYGFENFDEAGRYRETEGDFPVDASGSYVTPSGTSIVFENLDELVAGLAADQSVQECFSAYLATYAFGTSQGCLGSSQVDELQSGAIGIVEAFARLAGEPHFTQRKTQ